LKYFHENIIKYATFSDVKQNASQNSADFGGQDLPVKNILIRDYTIWPHFFWEKYEGWKSWNLLTNPIINLLLTGFWENPKCCEKQWKISDTMENNKKTMEKQKKITLKKCEILLKIRRFNNFKKNILKIVK